MQLPAHLSISNALTQITTENFLPNRGFKIKDNEVVSTPYVCTRVGCRTDEDDLVNGQGGMTMMHIWPEQPGKFEFDQTLKIASELPGVLTRTAREKAEGSNHPIGHFLRLWPHYQDAAKTYCDKNQLPQISDLFTSICASTIDIGLFDVMGKTLKRNPLLCVSANELGASLNDEVLNITRNQALNGTLKTQPAVKTHAWYTISYGEPLRIADEQTPVDGRPGSIEGHIKHNGMRHLKIKLGSDPSWNANRLIEIFALLQELCKELQIRLDEFVICLDANETFSSAEDLIASFDGVPREMKELIILVEQPFARAISFDKSQINIPRIKETLSKLGVNVKIFVDEAIETWRDIKKAADAGYDGVFLKLCRGVSDTVLSLAIAKSYGLLVDFMDLTMRAHSFIISVLFASMSNVTGVTGSDIAIAEYNAHQLFDDWTGGLHEQLQSLFKITEGGVLMADAPTCGFYKKARKRQVS